MPLELPKEFRPTAADKLAMISGDSVIDLILGQLAMRSDFSPDKLAALCDAVNRKFYEVSK